MFEVVEAGLRHRSRQTVQFSGDLCSFKGEEGPKRGEEGKENDISGTKNKNDSNADSPSAPLQTSSTLATSLTIPGSRRTSGDLVLGTRVAFVSGVAERAGGGVAGALGGLVLCRRRGDVKCKGREVSWDRCRES